MPTPSWRWQEIFRRTGCVWVWVGSLDIFGWGLISEKVLLENSSWDFFEFACFACHFWNLVLNVLLPQSRAQVPGWEADVRPGVVRERAGRGGVPAGAPVQEPKTCTKEDCCSSSVWGPLFLGSSLMVLVFSLTCSWSGMAWQRLSVEIAFLLHACSSLPFVTARHYSQEPLLCGRCYPNLGVRVVDVMLKECLCTKAAMFPESKLFSFHSFENHPLTVISESGFICMRYIKTKDCFLSFVPWLLRHICCTN